MYGLAVVNIFMTSLAIDPASALHYSHIISHEYQAIQNKKMCE